MSSIHKRLIVSIVLGLLALSLAASTMFYAYARHTFIRQFDQALEDKARAMATLVETDGQGHVEMEFSDVNMPEFVDKKAPQYFQVWLGDGSVLKKSHSLGKHELPHLKKLKRDHRRMAITLPNGRPGRMVSVSFHLQIEIDEKRPYPPDKSSPKGIIAVARDSDDLDDTLDGLLLLMIGGTVLLPGLAALIVWLSVRWGLLPLDDLGEEINRIDSPSEFHELDVAGLPAELKPIARQLNSMMDRLKSAFDRERQFTLDASHELRTPLSEARTALEVALKWPGDAALMESSCTDALGALRNMDSLVAALLALARADTGLLELKHEDVSLTPLVEEAWKRTSPRAAERAVLFELDGATDGLTVTSDRAMLLAIVTNLLDNAVEYCRPGTLVEAKLSGGADSAMELQVVNQVQWPLSQEDFHNIFEPLWRKEASRANEETTPNEKVHTGLGLALVRSFCRMMDIKIAADSPTAEVFRITLTFPRKNIEGLQDDGSQ